MRVLKVFLKTGLPLFGLLLWVGAAELRAQESSEAAAYREDYERYQTVSAVKDPVKRGDLLLQFIKNRPKSKLLPNVKNDYLQILQDLYEKEDYTALASRSEDIIKVSPRFGQPYYFLGYALKNQNKYPEAMNALAKCYLLTNPASKKAQTFLEFIYKSQHKGSTAGMDSIIKKARAELGG